MWIKHTVNAIQPGEQEVSLFPRAIAPAQPGILYAHGAEGSAVGSMAWMTIPGRWGIMREASALAPMLCPELGGNATWGNDLAISRADASYNYLQTLQGVAPGRARILAQSMGAVTAIAWAIANAGKVDRMVLIIPAINLTDIRTNSSTYRPAIDAAYGGTYTEAAFGAAHNPLTITQNGGLAGVKVQLWYGATDSLCKPEFAKQFAALLGADCEVHEMGGGHSEETVANVDPELVAGFLTP